MIRAREWLVKEGIADPGLVFVTGWSYGGYLTLLALGMRLDLWAGGMAGTAVADWAIASRGYNRNATRLACRALQAIEHHELMLQFAADALRRAADADVRPA